MTIRLEPITKDNWRKAYKLQVTEEQKQFVGPNPYSIIESLFEADHLFSAAAYDDDQMVGFAMYGFEDTPSPRRYWINRLMVDSNHQKKGYGRAIIQQLIDNLKQQPGCDAIYISFVPENTVARNLYISMGFEDTGTMDDNETVFRLPLEKSSEG